LFKSKNGKVLEWEISTEIVNNIPRYVVRHGYVGGSIQETFTEVKQGKNIGKASETTAIQQCELEAKSEWKKHRDRKGYAETLQVSTQDIAPMLAHSYDDHKDKVQFPVYIQPKLDGIRCLAYMDNGRVVLLSRQRKEFKHLDHIRKDLELSFFSANPNLILDGELYLHGEAFQSIISAVKRDEPSKNTENIQYHIYDNCHTEYGFHTRSAYLKALWVQNCKYLPSQSLQLVDTIWAHDHKDLEHWWTSYTNKGYEGVMIRNPRGLYVPDKRSKDLLKYKKFRDAEFEIIGAEQNKGKLSNTCVFICKTKEGTPFKVMPEGADFQRAQYWKDWKQGKIKQGDLITVKFFSWTDSKPAVPRFPIGVAIRDYE
jgi:ATP-dependent DNA ligase